MKVVTVSLYTFPKLTPKNVFVHYWLIGCYTSDDVVNSICNITLVSCRILHSLIFVLLSAVQYRCNPLIW